MRLLGMRLLSCVCSHWVTTPSFPSRELCVPFENGSDAEVAYQSLVVDPEPRRSGVTKVLRVESNTLLVWVLQRGDRLSKYCNVDLFFNLSSFTLSLPSPPPFLSSLLSFLPLILLSPSFPLSSSHPSFSSLQVIYSQGGQDVESGRWFISRPSHSCHKHYQRIWTSKNIVLKISHYVYSAN